MERLLQGDSTAPSQGDIRWRRGVKKVEKEEEEEEKLEVVPVSPG